MKPTDQILASLHETLAKELLARIETGEATAAELTAASKFLKDNGIDASLQHSEPMQDLAKILPFQDPDEIVRKTG
tara:strand:- start:1180 stop:1407 length:228 start_codon:yes stop_codon:yes gene_type:complete